MELTLGRLSRRLMELAVVRVPKREISECGVLCDGLGSCDCYGC
jgi:hypothetical protein